MVSQVTKTGMSKEEKLGIAVGAVAFIVVLLFFLVIGNMSFDATQSTQPIQPSQPIQPIESLQPEQSVQPTSPVQPIQPIQPVQPSQGEANQAQGIGMGELFMTVGALLLLVGLLYLARRFGWLRLERVSESHDSYPQLEESTFVESAPKSNQVVNTQLVRDDYEVLREQLEDKKQKVEELTRQLQRRQETIQRLASERNKASQEIQAVREALALSQETSLLDAVKKLVAEVKQLRELPKWEEVSVADLSEFWPTLQLDKKPFMSKRRQQRLLSRMRAENMKWMRAAPLARGE